MSGHSDIDFLARFHYAAVPHIAAIQASSSKKDILPVCKRYCSTPSAALIQVDLNYDILAVFVIVTLHQANELWLYALDTVRYE